MLLGQAHGPPAEVYAFGFVLYHIFSLRVRPPSACSSSRLQLGRHAHGCPPALEGSCIDPPPCLPTRRPAPAPQEPFSDLKSAPADLLSLVAQHDLRPTFHDTAVPPPLRSAIVDFWHGQPERRPAWADGIGLLRAALRQVAAELPRSDGGRAGGGGSRSDRQLVEDMLPAHVAAALRAGERVGPDNYKAATVFFSDICGWVFPQPPSAAALPVLGCGPDARCHVTAAPAGSQLCPAR